MCSETERSQHTSSARARQANGYLLVNGTVASRVELAIVEQRKNNLLADCHDRPVALGRVAPKFRRHAARRPVRPPGRALHTPRKEDWESVQGQSAIRYCYCFPAG
jgi:hypothetical protein